MGICWSDLFDTALYATVCQDYYSIAAGAYVFCTTTRYWNFDVSRAADTY